MGHRIFITGITGTLGTALTNLHHERGDQVWGCARNESRMVEWLGQHGRKATAYLTDVQYMRYEDSELGRLLPSMDRVYHCAAMKHVDLCEQQPESAFSQNVITTAIVTASCQDNDIPCVFISSDKACLPQGVYGATKLLGEKIALKHGAAVVRLGNLIGSSGSVFHRWKGQRDRGEPITITDPDMTRFFIKIEDAARFAADHAVPGRMTAPLMRSVRMGTVADSLSGRFTVVGMRPGETLHQWLIAPGEYAFKDGVGYVWGQDGYSSVYPGGVTSESAERWDTKKLLAEVLMEVVR